MNEQVFTITTSAFAASFVISTPSLMSEPSMISASTRFLAQPSEISPTCNGRSLDFSLVTGPTDYPTRYAEAILPYCPRLTFEPGGLSVVVSRQSFAYYEKINQL